MNALSARLVEISFQNDKKFNNITSFLEEYRTALCSHIGSVLSIHSYLKFKLFISVKVSSSQVRKLITSNPYLLIYKQQILEGIEKSYHEIYKKFAAKSKTYFDNIYYVKCEIYKIHNSPVGGMVKCKSSMPSLFKFTKSCILNIELPQTLQEMCFIYSVGASIKQVPLCEKPSRPHHYYDIVETFDKNSYCKLMPIHRFSHFENANRLNLNVFSINFEKKRLEKVFISDNSYYERFANLLLYNEHYYAIRNMANLIKLIKTRLGKKTDDYASRKVLNRNKLSTCMRCFQTVRNRKAAKRHSLYCLNKDSRFEMPDKDEFIEFSTHRALFMKPFIHYFDFEAMIQQCDVMHSENILQEGKHVPVSVGILRICADNDKFSKKIKLLHGNDVISQFWEYLKEEQKEVESIIHETNFPIHFSKTQLEKYQKAERCYSCYQEFSSNIKKVADHNHFKEKHNFRYALCDKCNLTYGANTDVNLTLLCHNLNYDIKFLLERIECKDKVEILARNSQNYLSVKIGTFLFLDTMNFLSGSLAQNIETVRRDSIDHFVQTKKLCPDIDKLNLLLKKQVYPYDYAKTLDDYCIPNLPPKVKFFNRLTQTNISDEEYEHAEHVYKIFNCQTFLDYHLVYLSSDVYLLSDCFELFRKNTMNNSGLDAAKFVTKHSLNFQEYLLLSREKIPLITDREILDFIQKGIKGGFSVINQKLAIANNPLCPQFYNPSKPKSYMLYLDANNLYSKALSFKLAFSEYRWLSQDEINKLDFKMLPSEGDIGYIVEADLIYPSDIHEQTADFPFCLERMHITDEMLSKYSLDLKNKLGLFDTRSKKLVGTMYDKKNYIIHSRLLSYFLNNGMKVTKIHKALAFYQKTWLKDYMDKNTKLRQQADSKIMRDFYKLKNNSLYGKLLQSDKNKIHVKVVTNVKDFDKQVSKPNFKSYHKLTDNVFLIVLEKKSKLTRPLPGALCCLDFAKLIMYQFHALTRECLPNSRILFSDTDSFLLYAETENIYSDLSSIKQYLDTSNYNEKHSLFSSSERLIPGLFKDEFPIKDLTFPEIPMIFVGLKPKMYMIYTNHSSYYTKSKGVGSNRSNKYKLQDFIDALINGAKRKERIISIRTRDAQIFTEQSIRTTLNSFDDKRYFINQVFSLPFGYFGLNSDSGKNQLSIGGK